MAELIIILILVGVPYVGFKVLVYFSCRLQARRDKEEEDLRAQVVEAAQAAGARPIDRRPRCVRCGAREDDEDDLLATPEGSMCDICYLEAK